MARATLLAACLLVSLGACMRPRPTWTLLQPPEVRNEGYPRGFQLLPGAPLSDWRTVAVFDSEAACEEARQRRTDDAIDHARAAVGEDAKNDLDVRRAVNARCVAAPR
ncbi:MAG TPA: hypothetical protein VMR79_03290 [Verrucomicrobiae bacterium]|nr:hypothetical protein [Verrucomicrobiae bacterium]